MRKKRHGTFTPKELSGLNHWRLENEDVETSSVFLFLYGVIQGIEDKWGTLLYNPTYRFGEV